MIKKSFVSFLVFALCFTLLTGFSGTNSTRDMDVLTGKTYLNLPEKSFDGPTEQSNITINNFVVNESNVSLIGQVTYGGKTYPINLEGPLHQDLLYRKAVSGSIKDLTRTFKVVYFAASELQDEQEKMGFNTINPEVGNKYLQIYLLREGSRELSQFEVNIENLNQENKEVIETLLAGYSQFDKKGENGEVYIWSQKVFKPQKGKFELFFDPNRKNEDDSDWVKVENRSTGDFSTMGAGLGDNGFHEHYDSTDGGYNFFYSETYAVNSSCDLTYQMEAQYYTDADAQIIKGNFGTANYSIGIKNKWTDSNCALYVSDTSPFGIGTDSDPVHMVSRTDGYDEYGFLDYGGYYTKLGSGEFNVAIGVGVSAYGTQLGLNYTYTFTKEGVISPPVDLKYMAESEGYDDPVHKFGLVRKELILTDEQHHFAHKADLKGMTTGSKTLDTKWNIVISAKYDGSFSYKPASLPDAYQDLYDPEFYDVVN
jgi:hypothetical protein